MSRTGMSNLITRLRAMTQAGTADYTLDSDTYFSDDHLQAILDANVTLLETEPLQWLPTQIGGGTIQWLRCTAGYTDYEESSGGTAVWAVRDGPGNLIGGTVGTAAYSVNYNDGMIDFTSDQGGTAYYLTARSYDLYSAAADLWLQRQAYYTNWASWQSTDGDMSIWQTQWSLAKDMEAQMRKRAKQNVPQAKASMRTTHFRRADIGESWKQGGGDAGDGSS
jgi:hypothetical protein